MTVPKKHPISSYTRTMPERRAFWRYCVSASARAIRRGKVPCTIDAHFIDTLLVDQKWKCAVCGIPLTAPRPRGTGTTRDPFGPSIDRIVPALGYVPGNVRVVAMMVNTAMGEWGEGALRIMLEAYRKNLGNREFQLIRP